MELILASRALYVAVGATCGLVMAALLARIAPSGGRRVRLAVLASAAGAAASYLLAAEAGMLSASVAYRSAAGAWLAAWSALQVAAFWRESYAMGRVLDRTRSLLLVAVLATLVALALATGNMGRDVSLWALAAAPLASSAMYRGALVFRLARLSPRDQEVTRNRIAQILRA